MSTINKIHHAQRIGIVTVGIMLRTSRENNDKFNKIYPQESVEPLFVSDIRFL